MPGPPFFIIGSARSGTTLLRVILNSHQEVAVPPESRFVTELWNGRDEVEVAAFLDRLAAHRQFQGWNLPVDAIARRLSRTRRLPYSEAVGGVYETYAEAHGKKRWGDKTPRYVESIPFISKLFPEARFVHLVRDRRNVALSYAGMPFGPKTVPKAAALWARRVSAGIKDGRPIAPSRYLEIRYEDLVDDPERYIKELCTFLDLSYDPGMLEYTEGARDFVFEKAAQYNPHVMEKPNPKVRSWESEMPQAHVRLFEAVAGDVLDAFGYPRRFPRPGPAATIEGVLGRIGVPIGRLKSVTE